MSDPTSSIIDTRRHQMFPTLAPAEVERMRRFGEVRSFAKGEALAKVGQAGLGMTIILKGTVDITQHNPSRRGELIVTHGPGEFMGELAQLAGRPAGIRQRRASHHRPPGGWGRASAGRLSPPQRPSASKSEPRCRYGSKGADRAISCRSRSAADRPLSGRTVAA